jgi:DNA-binding NarL/FixJ family response regulator
MNKTETPAQPVRVMVVDDHPLLREGIAAVLSVSDNYVLVAEAGDGREGWSSSCGTSPTSR